MTNEELQSFVNMLIKQYKHEILRDGDWWHGTDEYSFNIHSPNDDEWFNINVYKHDAEKGMDDYSESIDLPRIYLGNKKMKHKLTNEEKAFIKAYRLCVGSAFNEHIEYYFSNRERVQLCNAREEHLIIEGCEYWSHIEDFWLLWQEAKEYALKPPVKTYKVTATYSAESEVYIEAESAEQAQAMALECGDFDGTIDADDWQIQHIEEVTK